MTVRLSLFSLASMLFLIVLAGCGSGAQIATPASEGFTNASLSGTYAFFVGGTDSTGTAFAFAGSIQANGSGSITGGTVDINSPAALATPLTNTPVTGTYNVLSDGRTMANLTVAAINASFTIDFVLLSSSTGLVIRFDTGGTASGSIDLQNSSAFSTTALAGSFAFNLFGVDASLAHPEGTAGSVTFNSAGSVTGGIQDVNDSGAVLQGLGITGGTLVNPANGRGTLSITNSSGQAFDFAFYVIDANHIRMVSTDAGVISGDAFRQPSSLTLASAFPAGSAVFTLSGTAASGSFADGGILTADGNGNITAGTEDSNAAGTLTQNISATGTYTVSANGRGTLGLASTGQSLSIYPTMTGGLLMFDLVNVAGGTALEQSGSFSNSSINGSYGLNFSAVNLNLGAEVDAIAQFSANGSGSIPTGAIDLNIEGSLSPSGAINGTYSTNSNGRGTGTLNIPNANQNLGIPNLSLIYYIATGSRVLFIEADPLQPAAGVFATQTM